MVYSDTVYHTTTTHLSKWDAIKAFLGRPVIVRSEIDTEHEVGKTSARSESRVPGWGLLRRELPQRQGSRTRKAPLRSYSAQAPLPE